MDFRQVATDETSRLVDVVLADHVERSNRQLEVAREGLAAAARAIEAMSGPVGTIDRTVQQSAVVDRLAAVAEAGTEDSLRSLEDRYSLEVESAREQLQAERARNHELTTVLNEAQALRSGLQSEKERLECELTRSHRQFENFADELRQEHVQVMTDQVVACTELPLDQLLQLFRGIEKSTTLSDFLDNFAEGLACEFARVVVFRIHGNRLEGTQQMGFGGDTDLFNVAIPLVVDSLLTRAVATGHMEASMKGAMNETEDVPFGGTPTCAVALPITLPGETVAVIYADDSDGMEGGASAPQLAVKFAELFWQHALVVLRCIAVQQRARTELREHAATLLKQLEDIFRADAESGRTEFEGRARLIESLELARRVYRTRAAPHGPDGEFIFDEQLSALLSDRANTSFGRALATATKSFGSSYNGKFDGWSAEAVSNG